MNPVTSRPAIVWFRDDLRVADNPALRAAAAGGRPVLALYVLDDDSKGIRALGGASRWWLAGSLRTLAQNLARTGLTLTLRRGRAADVVRELARRSDAAAVHWNRRYGHAAASDNRIEQDLRADGVDVATFNGSLLFEPGAVRTKSGGTPRVFTPFWRMALASGEPRAPSSAPKQIEAFGGVTGENLADWKLEPAAPDWAGGLRATWQRGENAAKNRLADFIDHSLQGYAAERERPDIDSTSRLSPYLRFGEISPHQVWRAATAAQERGDANAHDVEKFLAELGWREFSYHLLQQFPDLATRNFQSRFDAFPWRAEEKLLLRWQRGETGYPIVDAGMRQLWHTGFMHNRVRMVVASFLVKHLLIDWREGERWFWDTLVDADPANNPASWQWVAGSGADAASYFRVFNPTLQGEKFDPDGDYVRRWVPELAHLPAASMHQPTPVEAPDYPAPVVDHAKARARALDAFASLKA